MAYKSGARTAPLAANRADHWLVKAVLMAASTLIVTATATLTPAAPIIEAAFPDQANIAWWTRVIIMLPALFIVIGSPLAGAFVDRFGRKPLLIAATIVFSISGTAGFITESIPLLLVERALVGLSVAAIITCATTLITDYYTGAERAQLLGLQGMFIGLSATVIALAAGYLAEIDWQMPFLIYTLGLIVLPFLIGVLYEPPRRSAPPPPTTAAASTAPRDRGFARLMLLVYGTVFFGQLVFGGVGLQLPYYLPEVTGGSSADAGLAMSALSLLFALTSAFARWVKQRLTYALVYAISFSLVAAALFATSQAQGWPALLIALPVMGVGFGLVQPIINVWLANAAPNAVRGRVIGGFTTAIFLGQFASTFVVQPLSDLVGIRGMFVVMGISMALIAVGGLIAQLRQQRTRAASAPAAL